MLLLSSAVFYSQILQLKATFYISFTEDYSSHLVVHKTLEIQVVAYFQLVTKKRPKDLLLISLYHLCHHYWASLNNILSGIYHKLVLEQLV